MHRFEYFDFSTVQPPELLKQAYSDRYNRIKDCKFSVIIIINIINLLLLLIVFILFYFQALLIGIKVIYKY
jgi:hypothetical protein